MVPQTRTSCLVVAPLLAAALVLEALGADETVRNFWKDRLRHRITIYCCSFLQFPIRSARVYHAPFVRLIKMAGKSRPRIVNNVDLPRLVTNIGFSIRYCLDVAIIMLLIRENSMIPVFPSVIEIYRKIELVLNPLSRWIFHPISFCLFLVRHA
jgi:hypothetical protein